MEQDKRGIQNVNIDSDLPFLSINILLAGES